MEDLDDRKLKEIIHYDPVSGLFIWKTSPRFNVPRGSVAGSVDCKGYIRIGIDGAVYKAHRLAWFYMTGNWPSHQIDHKNRNRADNRWDNLQEATAFEQGENHSVIGNGESGVRGVHRHGNKWRAQIWDNISGKNKHLGLFDNIEAARQAVLAARGG